MFQLISMIVSFLKEVFFKNKGQADFKNTEFDITRWVLYILVLTSFVINTVAMPRLFILGVKAVRLQTQIEQLERENKTYKDTIELLVTENKNIAMTNADKKRNASTNHGGKK